MAEREGLLPFKLIEEEAGEALTSYGGLPLVLETCEALGLARLIKQHVGIKQRDRGFSESKYVESVIALIAAGGDCLEDIERLRSDAGLKLLLGKLPSAEAVRFFLYGFHDEKLLEGKPDEGAFIAEETRPLAGLWEVNREVVIKASRKEAPQQATIDQDATVIQSHKEQSRMTYLGERGYQPVINYWVEQDLILSDEFRDLSACPHRQMAMCRRGWTLYRRFSGRPGRCRRASRRSTFVPTARPTNTSCWTR